MNWTLDAPALAAFLAEAMRQNKSVTLHMGSGHEFTKVMVTDLDDQTVEVTERSRKYVVSIQHVEWAVLS